MSIEDSCREMIKLRENPYLLVIYNQTEEERMRELYTKNYSGSIFFLIKHKKVCMWGQLHQRKFYVLYNIF